eukprot:1038628-Amphidinium_carterae.1
MERNVTQNTENARRACVNVPVQKNAVVIRNPSSTPEPDEEPLTSIWGTSVHLLTSLRHTNTARQSIRVLTWIAQPRTHMVMTLHANPRTGHNWSARGHMSCSPLIPAIHTHVHAVEHPLTS